MEHHDHAPAHLQHAEADPVDPDQTARLLALSGEPEHAGTPIAYFLSEAAAARTRYARRYWLRRVEGAEHNLERAKGRERLAAAARRSLEAWEETAGTEAQLSVDRIVGNSVVLRLIPGLKRPTGHYSLERRRAGERGTTDEGRPREWKGSHFWTVQQLDMGAVHEFAVCSNHDGGHAWVTGPWLAVPIGTVSTKTIQDADAAEAARERDEAFAQAAEHTARVQRERVERAEALEAQGEAARAANERREAEIAAKMELHRQAVEELPQCAPRDMTVNIRKAGKMLLADIRFKRGLKAPDIYQFKVNGTVLGYFPDGRHSGRKPLDHVYERTVELPQGVVSRVEVYGVTKHGDASVAQEVSDESEAPRMTRITGAVRRYHGQRTRGRPAGRPYLRQLRAQSGIDDISARERDRAFAATKED